MISRSNVLRFFVFSVRKLEQLRSRAIVRRHGGDYERNLAKHRFSHSSHLTVTGARPSKSREKYATEYRRRPSGIVLDCTFAYSLCTCACRNSAFFFSFLTGNRPNQSRTMRRSIVYRYWHFFFFFSRTVIARIERANASETKTVDLTSLSPKKRVRPNIDAQFSLKHPRRHVPEQHCLLYSLHHRFSLN